MTKKIYIAGKVSGLPYEETKMKFCNYAKKLMERGHQPVVPFHLCDEGDEWHIAMRKCIAALCTCDEIHLLPDWVSSPGAYWEREIAMRLGIEVVFVKEKSAFYYRPDCCYIFCDDPEDCKKKDYCHYQ